MAKYRPILIACPQYLTLVRGQYACDAAGRYRLSPNGQFLLPLVRCDHYGGRCMQTLCALHRFNRQGNGSWYPEKILAVPQPAKRRSPALARRGHAPPQDGSTFCLEA